MDLRAHYSNYISHINARSYQTFSDFVSDGIVHNDSQPMSVQLYAQIIIDGQASFRDQKFEIQMLVLENDDSEGNGSLAARLRLTYIPDSEQGKSVEEAKVAEFYEHVFYRFENGKIVRVWSLLDGAGQKWKEERKA